LSEELKSYKSNIDGKTEEFRSKIKELENEKMENKVNYEKTIALAEQES
jgi:hypothetical protein